MFPNRLVVCIPEIAAAFLFIQLEGGMTTGRGYVFVGFLQLFNHVQLQHCSMEYINQCFLPLSYLSSSPAVSPSSAPIACCSWPVMNCSARLRFTMKKGEAEYELQTAHQVPCTLFLLCLYINLLVLSTRTLKPTLVFTELLLCKRTSISHYHGLSLEKTAACWETCIQVPVCGLLPGVDGRVHQKMVRSASCCCTNGGVSCWC